MNQFSCIHRHICSDVARRPAADRLLGTFLIILIFLPAISWASPRLVIGEGDLSSIPTSQWIEMRDDGTHGDGLAGDGVFTARYVISPASSEKTFSYLVLPPGQNSLGDAIGLFTGSGTSPAPVPLKIPASSYGLTVEVRYSQDALNGFEPSPSIADSWNTGYSMDLDLQRDKALLITGEFQALFGDDKWDTSSQIPILKNSGFFDTEDLPEEISALGIISPIGIDSGLWRVAGRTTTGSAPAISLGPEGWAEALGDPESGFELPEIDRWMPARFEVDLLRGQARVANAPSMLRLPMISQVVPEGGTANFVNIFNPSDALLALAGVYLADDREYYLLPEIPSKTIRQWDFNVTFPEGAWVGARNSRSVGVNGVLEDYNNKWGKEPDYLIVREPNEDHHMLLAYEVSVGSQRGLTTAGEYVVLYSWPPGDTHVEDLDAVVWGGDSNLLPLKHEIDNDNYSYGVDSGKVNASRAPGVTSGNPAISRKDFRRSGNQRFFACSLPCVPTANAGYNGVFHHRESGRYDATDQDLSILFSGGAASPGSAPMLSLEGSIEDQNGDPISNATIRATSLDLTHSTESEPDGTFVLELPFGKWRISVFATGYSSTSFTTLIDHKKEIVDPIVLEASTRVWNLSGLVVSEEDDSPIAGASLTLNPGGHTTLTNILGEFSFDVLENSYTLEVSASSFHSLSMQVDIDKDSSIVIPLSPVPFAVNVQGRVLDSATQEPISGATLTLDDQQGNIFDGLSDAEGVFEFTDIPTQTTYLLQVQAEGYSTYTQSLDIEASDLIDIVIDLEEALGELSIYGTVTRSDTAEGISGASVELQIAGDTPRRATTTSSGAFIIDGLPADDYEVSASALGFTSNTQRISLSEDSEMNFVLMPVASDRVAVFGEVRRADTQSPLQGASVELEMPDGTFRTVATDVAGSYRIEDLKPNEYRITAYMPGFESSVEERLITEDAEINFGLTPKPSGIASVSGVVSLQGQPQNSWAGSTIIANGPSYLSVITGPNGLYTLKDIRVGEYTISVSREGYANKTVEVEIFNNITLDFNLLPESESEGLEPSGCDCTSTDGQGLWFSISLLIALLGLVRPGHPRRQYSRISDPSSLCS